MKIILSAFRKDLPEHVNLRNHTELYNILRMKYGKVLCCVGSYMGDMELSVLIEVAAPNLAHIKVLMERYQQETCLFIWNDSVAEFYQPNKSFDTSSKMHNVSIHDECMPIGDYTLVLKTKEYIYVS